mgnify:CR=1 FL=1
MFIALLTAAPGHAEAKAWQAAFKVTNSPSVKSAAPIITGTVNPERAKVVARYAGVAALTGNSANGHALFLANCAACHKLKGEGNEIGPDLGTIAGKPTEQLLEAIFDPSRAVEQRYLLQTITLKDGRTLAGLVSEQNANAVTLKLGTVTEVILREQVAKIETSNKSLMPDGLEAILNPQQTADLLAWGRRAYELQAFDQAAEAYLEVLKKDPKNVEAVRRVGILLFMGGRPEEARIFLEIAQGADPEAAEGWLFLGNLYFQEGRMQEAIAAWEKYLEAGGEAKERVEALIAMAKAQAQGGKDGRSVYEARCAACHGLQGEGGVGPRLKGNPILKVPEAVREIVLQGRGTMPAVPLSEEELEALLGYLGSL